MNYKEMKQYYIRGWHTWNTRSVLSHVHMPDGLAINLAFKEYRTGHYLKEALIGRFKVNDPDPLAPEQEVVTPGLHALDDNYTEITVSWTDLEMRVESAVDGDDLLLLITPIRKQVKPAMLVAETAYLWNRPGYTGKEGDVVTAHGKDDIRVIRSTGTAMEDLNVPIQSAALMICLDQPVAVYTGEVRSLEEIQEKIRIAREKLLEKNKENYGEMAEAYEAVQCALGWDTIYDPMFDRVFSPVSRLWCIGNGGYILAAWDNCFVGYMAALECKELAYSNLMEIINEHTEKGFVPNIVYGTRMKTEDRSEPLVGSAMMLETYRIHREKWIVEEIYPGLLNWNTWYWENRRNPSGTLCWGSDECPVLYGNEWESKGVHDRFGASLESGMDNSPMYDDIPFDPETNMLKLEDVGLTGLFIKDCKALIELAAEIGKEEDIPILKERLRQAEQGMDGLWDEEFGFYCNRRTDTGEFSRRISPVNFHALYSSVPEERLQRIAKEHYYNPEEFYGEWMIPTIARNDPAFPDQDYWRGRIWGPTNFLAYQALCNTSLADVRKDLAEKSVHLFMKEWTEHRHIHENYNGMTGEGCDVINSDRFYHWGALLMVIMLAEKGIISDFGLPLN